MWYRWYTPLNLPYDSSQGPPPTPADVLGTIYACAMLASRSTGNYSFLPLTSAISDLFTKRELWNIGLIVGN